MRFQFEIPPGWSKAPFPPPGRGIYLRAGSLALDERAAVLLLAAVAPIASLEAQLELIVQQSCGDADVLERDESYPVQNPSFSGRMLNLRIRQRNGREEIRAVTLLDAGTVRLPIVFLGGRAAREKHLPALDRLIRSIHRVDIDVVDESGWVDG